MEESASLNEKLNAFLFKCRISPQSSNTGISLAELLMNKKLNSKLNNLKPGAQLNKNLFLAWIVSRQFKEADKVWNPNLNRIPVTILCRTGPISYKALTKKGVVKKRVDHLQKKESPKKPPRFTLRCSWKKQDLHRNETTANSPVTANNSSQKTSDPRTQKHLRTQINNFSQLASENLIEPQPQKTNSGSSGSGGDSNIVLRQFQQPPKQDLHRLYGNSLKLSSLFVRKQQYEAVALYLIL